MSEGTRHRGTAGVTAVIDSLDQRLENETEILDAFLLALAGETLGRYLFFVSAVPKHLAAPYLGSEAA